MTITSTQQAHRIDDSTPAWATVGATVAVLKANPRRGSTRIHLTQLTQVNHLALVTAEGERFNPRSLEATRSHGAAATRLASPDDPGVREQLRYQETLDAERSRSLIRARYMEFLQNPSKRTADLLAKAAGDFPPGTLT